MMREKSRIVSAARIHDAALRFTAARAAQVCLVLFWDPDVQLVIYFTTRGSFPVLLVESLTRPDRIPTN